MPDIPFQILKDLAENRRTVKPAFMNGKLIPDEEVESLLELADWAPTHGRTEPWRFFVYAGEPLKEFGKMHADLYWQNTDEAVRDQKKYDKLKENVTTVSHLLVAAMKRGNNPNIPALEEICAVSAAIQNVLLGAQALGIAAMWNTGGMTHHPAFRAHLGLGEEDMVLAIIYLGYTDEPVKEVPRKIALADKVKWMR